MSLPRPEALPKIELHCHLDGGLRTSTVVELAEANGYIALPSTDPVELAEWFYQGKSGSLVRYLAGFEHTVGVLQTQEAIERVAYEAAIDMHDDGVIYAESRFAPFLNTRQGLRREDAIEAALAGFERATRETGLNVGLIVDAMRDRPDSVLDAQAAVRFAGQGVVGFDLAGPEEGFPPEAHREACLIARRGGLGITIHAGEASGPESIAAALDSCNAQRIGHGIRVIDEVDAETLEAGPIAERVRDEFVPLEVCPTSNLHTLGIGPEEHSLGLLKRAGFNVTLNTDNRLMSSVSLSDEFVLAVQYHGFDVADLEGVTLAAVSAAFLDDAAKAALTARVEAGYASWRSSQAAT